MENQKDKKKKKVLMPFGLRNKLMAAISMLLVSSIMLVSSTYAWFTLSTAPEVKGISTSVGANGNLEMALLNTDSFKDLTKITSAVGDSYKTANKTLATANVTWGNLVNLDYSENGANHYGLDKIKLMPARLNAAEVGKLNTTKFLLTPIYGDDGRVTELKDETFSSANFSTSGFVVDTDAEKATYGVRAVGESSTMTPQEKGLANAKSNYVTNMNAAKNEVSTALKTNMQNLANAMLSYAGDANYNIKPEEQAAITALLNGMDAALNKIDMAYGDVLRAYAANKIADAKEYEAALEVAVVAEAKGEDGGVTTPAVTFANATYTQSIEKLGTLGFTVDDAILTAAAGNLKTMRDAVTAARTKTTNDPADYAGAVKALVDTDDMTMMGLSLKRPADGENGEGTVYSYDEKTSSWKVDQGKVASKAFGGGLKDGMELVMGNNSGLFADIAKVTGNYTASGNIDIEYGELKVTNALVSMKTNAIVSDTVKPVLAIITANEHVSGNTRYITDTYGYIIDLAVRTNATNSKLLLAKDGVQRVYNDGEVANQETMGAGSTMSFKSVVVDTTPVLADLQVQNLMKAIRVVFFNPDNGEVYGYAILDDLNTADGTTTGKLVLQDATLDGGKLTFKAKTGEEADVLMALQQNTATKISVLVYLDGDMVDNSMVANAAESITGSLNLQFKSSATLKPMENSTLRNGTK